MGTNDTVLPESKVVQIPPPEVSHGTPFHLSNHYVIASLLATIVPPLMILSINDTRLVERERLETRIRQMRL